jgi:NFU1 iron-sulfur cluster scaffold homolog, mitochondrial
MALLVKEIQPTPNPNAMKYVLDQIISPEPASFFAAEPAQKHPIASRLFAIPGVAGVLLLKDFVTVNKQPSAKWSSINRQVKRVLEQATGQ